MSDFDEYKKQQQEFIEARRIKNTVPDSELAKNKNDSEKIVPRTFKEKWKNYWYHYKATTWGCLLGGILLFTFIWQMTHPQVFDASVSVVSELPFDGADSMLRPPLEECLIDYSGNEVVELELPIYTLPTENNKNSVDPQMMAASQAKLVARLSVGEDAIFLTDSYGFEQLKGMGLEFIDLSQLSDSPNVEGARYSLKGTKLVQEMGLNDEVAGQISLSLIDLSAYGDNISENEKVQKKHQDSLDYLKKLIAFG